MANEFRIKNGLIVSGNATVTGIVLDGNTITGVDDSGEFTDNDAHIMTSAGINDKFGVIAGSTSIVTVGTITTGTWNGTAIDLANYVTGVLPSANLDADTAHLSGTQTFSGNKTFSGSITLGGHAVNDIDVAGEFVDSDEHLMTSAAINDRIAAAGGGASVLGDLTDVLIDATNFTDSILIQADSDGSAPTTGTLNDATRNTGYGASVFKHLTDGFYNTGIGYHSLEELTGGARNTAVGYESLGAITTSNYNVAIGFQAGAGAWSGADSNIAIGYQALNGSLTADKIIAIGRQAGQAHTSGTDSIYMGTFCALNVTTGNRNIVIGYEAYDGATSESDNIAIGHSALGGAVNGAEKNVVIGNYAGDAVTSGDENTLIGHQSGTTLTTAKYSVAVGYRSLYNTDTGDRNTAVGYLSMEGAANNSADQNAAFGGYTLKNVQDGATGNTGLGYLSLSAVTTGDKNIAIGYESGDNITTGSNNVVIGAADVSSATGSDQLSISSGDGGVTWITGTSDSGVLMGDGTIPNGSTAGQLTISNANADTFAHTLLLVDSEDDTTNGPVLTLYRNTASPADNDILGKIQFNGEDSNGDARAYGNIRTESVDVTNGSHDGAMIFNTAIAGTQTDIFRIDTGVRAMIAGVVNITGTTTLSDEQSGSYVYVTGSGAPTLPPTAIAGQQFTLINNTGGNLTVGLGTSNAIASGWTAHAVMADETARTYFSPEANKWIYIG